MTKSEDYRGFLIRWDEPPHVGNLHQVEVVPQGAESKNSWGNRQAVIDGTDHADALRNAKELIDEVSTI